MVKTEKKPGEEISITDNSFARLYIRGICLWLLYSNFGCGAIGIFDDVNTFGNVFE